MAEKKSINLAEEKRKRKPNFLRRDSSNLSRLGKGRKKKRIWKKPRGRDNKLRERVKGYGKVPSVGYKIPREFRFLIKGLKPIVVYNKEDLKEIKDNEIVIMGKVGKKKKLEILSKIKELKIKVAHIKIDEVLNKIKKEQEKKKAKKQERLKKQSEKEKQKKKKGKKEEKEKTEQKSEEKKEEQKEKSEEKQEDKKEIKKDIENKEEREKK